MLDDYLTILSTQVILERVRLLLLRQHNDLLYRKKYYVFTNQYLIIALTLKGMAGVVKNAALFEGQMGLRISEVLN